MPPEVDARRRSGRRISTLAPLPSKPDGVLAPGTSRSFSVVHMNVCLHPLEFVCVHLNFFAKPPLRFRFGLGCCCIPILLAWPLSPIYPVYCTAGRANCTAKTALNEDQYEESGRCCVLDLSDESRTHTRLYVNGHATNAFAGSSHPFDVLWHRDPGLLWQPPFIFAKKVG